MKIVRASAEIIFPSSLNVAKEMVLLIEKAARLCYKTEYVMIDNKINESFIKDKIERGHHSILEHSMVTVKFVVDRGVSHAIVRHRLASYSQESTRYCNYANYRFGKEITVIEPLFFDGKLENMIWYDECLKAEEAYFKLLEFGATPQEARSVLPNSLKTELIMTGNFREWRHFFSIRTCKDSHPQMLEVTIPLLAKFKQMFPPIFSDIEVK